MLNEWSQTPFMYIQKNFYPQGISDQKLSVWLHFQRFKPSSYLDTINIYDRITIKHCKDLQPSCSKADQATEDIWSTAVYKCNLNYHN